MTKAQLPKAKLSVSEYTDIKQQSMDHCLELFITEIDSELINKTTKKIK